MISNDDFLMEVQQICNRTSERIIPTPIIESITEDLLIGLKRFKITAWWKEFWKYNDLSKKTLIVNKSNIEKDKINHHQTGFKTNARNPNCFPTAPKGSNTLESFLCQLEDDLLEEALNLQTTKKTK